MNALKELGLDVQTDEAKAILALVRIHAERTKAAVPASMLMTFYKEMGGAQDHGPRQRGSSLLAN
jgi:hypothetical protein